MVSIVAAGKDEMHVTPGNGMRAGSPKAFDLLDVVNVMMAAHERPGENVYSIKVFKSAVDNYGQPG